MPQCTDDPQSSEWDLNCELSAGHTGPHRDGMFWWNADKVVHNDRAEYAHRS